MTAPSPLVLPTIPAPSAPNVVQAVDPVQDAGQLPIDPLPYPAPGWGAEQAGAALTEAALALPSLEAPAELVRAVSTVVFRVGDQAVKVHPPGTDPVHLGRVHAVLAGSAVALTVTCAPVVTSHGVVTVSPWLSAATPVDWRALGSALRALHELPSAGDLPAWTPLRRLPAQLEHLPAPYARALRERRHQLLQELERLVPVLPAGAVHGDVSPDNVLRSGGAVRWIDLDFASAGLREYDVAAVVRRYAAGAITDADYRGFVAGYGADLRGWPGLTLLDELCVLSGIGFRLWQDRARGHPSTWLPGQLTALSGVPAGS